MSTLFLLFSHALTAPQEADARASLGVGAIRSLPEALQQCWSQVPPELADLRAHAEPILDWLEQEAKAGDYVLVQGDFGMAVLVVKYCQSGALKAIYSTTQRQSVDKHQADGAIKTERLFRHIRYREYP